jgi:hypothetical protein
VKALLLATVLLVAPAKPSVYITAKGAHYHTVRECIALRSAGDHVQTTTADKVGDRTLCGICARRKPAVEKGAK